MSIFFTTLAINHLQLPFSKSFSNKKALNDLLSTVQLSLFSADGSVRQTSKNKLGQILKSKSNEENTDASKGSTVYVVDLMALMQVVTVIPGTFEDLVLKLISILPN